MVANNTEEVMRNGPAGKAASTCKTILYKSGIVRLVFVAVAGDGPVNFI